MFGWNTPDSLKVWNKQKEANLHNLWIFARENSDGTLKQGLASIMTASKMFSLFWMGYCVALPLAHRFSDKLRLLVNRFQVPIVPLGIGILFVLNYIAAKISQLVIQAQHVHQITEIKWILIEQVSKQPLHNLPETTIKPFSCNMTLHPGTQTSGCEI